MLAEGVQGFYPFLGEGSPTKIDFRKKGTLIVSFLLEDLAANKLTHLNPSEGFCRVLGEERALHTPYQPAPQSRKRVKLENPTRAP